jgi:regulatory protein
MPMPRSKQEIHDEASLFEYSVRALGRRMHSIAELKRKLRNRCSDESTIESVVRRLKDLKYLNDSSYAAAYSAFRRDNEKFGRRRVTTDLKVKGIHADVIAKAVDQTYRDVNELELAQAFLRRKRLKKPDSNKEAARIFRALLRAGFGMSTAVKALKNWQVDDEVITALQEGTERAE